MKKSILQFCHLFFLLHLLTPISLLAQEVPNNLSGESLRVWLKANYYDGLHTTLGYSGQNGARSYMYNIIDNHNDTLTCVYGGLKVYRMFDLTRAAGTGGVTPINCEHSIPQSFFGESEPMRSDIHHLYPSYQNWNSTRQNFPFKDIEDQLTTKWMLEEVSQSGIPTSNIDAYSEYHSSSFEPREDHKGNIARAVFYFYAMYPTEAGSMSLVGDSSTFYQWHLDDPVDAYEEQRNEDILLYQGNENVFITKPGLLERIWDLGNLPSPNIALEASCTEITLTWGDMPAETGYHIYRSTDSLSFSLLGGTLPANTTTYVDHTAAPDSTYYYHLTAAYHTGESLPGPLCSGELAPSIPPAAVSDLALTATTSSIELSWSDGSRETGYQIYRSVDNSTFHPLGGALASNTVNYMDNTPAGGTIYSYFIVANNTHGSSANSNTIDGQLIEFNTTATDLIISEYIEGSSFNKAIEIANFTGATVDLAKYELGKQTNGAGTWSKLALTGNLPDKAVYVIVNNNASDSTLLAEGDLFTSSSVVNFNGNDPVALFDAGATPDYIIDIVGTEDGGTDYFAQNVTLVRDSSLSEPNSLYTASEWIFLAQDDLSHIGSHRMNLGAILPVALSNFAGFALDGFHRLEWETQIEINHHFYEIQESLDGLQFETIGRRYGRGNTSPLQRYEFLVKAPPSLAYYRLKLVDLDDRFTYSKKIALQRKAAPINIQVSPIPASTFVSVKLEVPTPHDATIAIYDLTGRLVYFDHTFLSKGTHHKTIPLETFNNGYYLLEVKAGGAFIRTKLIKQRP